MLRYITVILFLLYTIISCLSKNKPKEQAYIIGAFNLFWGIALVLSLCSFSGKYAISTETYLLITIGILSFNWGFKYKNRTSFQFDALIQSANRLISNNAFNFIVLLLNVYILSLFVIYIDTLSISSAADLRTDFFDEKYNLYGPLFLVLNTWVLKPFSILLLPLLPVSILLKRKKQIAIYLIFLLVYNSLGGGRFGYTQIFWSLYLVLICIFQKIKIRFSFRNIAIVVVVVIFYGLIAFTTASRMAGFDINNIKLADNEVIKETNSQLSAYVSGPIAAFSYAIDNDYVKKMGGYQYGKLTFGAFDQVLDITLRKIGIGYERSIPKLSTIKQDSRIIISDELTSWNALYTSNLFYYLDFGFIGIIVIPFLFAQLFSKSLMLMHRKLNIMSLVLVNYIFVNCMHSIFDFRLYKLEDLVTFSVLLFLAYKSNSLKLKLS